MKKEERKSKSRSRSPLRRHIQFAEPVSKVVTAAEEEAVKGMRMKDAREAVPRKEGESRQQWKNRIFNYKRQEEAKKEGARAAPKLKKWEALPKLRAGSIPSILRWALGKVPPVEAGENTMKPGSAGDLVKARLMRSAVPSLAVGTVGPSVSREEYEIVSQGLMDKPIECEEAPLLTSEIPVCNFDECQLFDFCHLTLLMKFRFQTLCHRAATFEPCATQLGVSLLQLLLVSPRDGAKIRKWISKQWLNTSTTPTRVRDLLPLPLPPAGAAMKLIRLFEVTDVGLLLATTSNLCGAKKSKRQQAHKLLVEGSKQIWRLLVVIVLNGLNSNWNYPPTCRVRLTELQETAMSNINRWIDAFCSNPLSSHKVPEFSKLVKSKTIDYAGEEVAHALPLRLEELLPGLPVHGVAGSLSAVEAASGDVKSWVIDPNLALKPQELWPKNNPRARINATRSEWYRICSELYTRGIIECIKLDEVFVANGSPVLNGAFAVEKKGQPGEGQVRVTRLIMNFVPANAFQKLMPGDLATLASASSWTQFVLGTQEVLLWSGDDQRGAFYAWELPHAWRPFMAFAWPMGWIQAVSLFQHLHRRIGMSPQPAGAGHGEEQEWRRDRPTPQSPTGKVTEFVLPWWLWLPRDRSQCGLGESGRKAQRDSRKTTRCLSKMGGRHLWRQGSYKGTKSGKNGCRSWWTPRSGGCPHREEVRGGAVWTLVHGLTPPSYESTSDGVGSAC